MHKEARLGQSLDIGITNVANEFRVEAVILAVALLMK
jgi:hypothetical protein